MENKRGSPAKLAANEILKWLIAFLVSFAVLAGCVCLYNYVNAPVPGEVFTGSAKGMFCDILAEVTVADGKIVDVKLTGDGETPELGGVVLAELPAKILAAQSSNVDGMAGATVTTNAARDAVTQALIQAGLLIPVEAEEAVQAPAKTAGELILDSYNATAENSYAVPYLETDPYLVNLYEGFGFAKQYDSARGHAYSLEDLANTARPHPLANCLTCKTADFTKLVQEQGVSAYSLDFDEVMASMNESIGCYSCHADKTDTGELVVTHDYFTDKLDMSGIDAATLSCGQCHIEYYFDPATKATTIPYTNAAEMTPEAMLAYYDAMDFADWTQPSTGAKLLKAQHPEMETYLNGSIHANFGMSCASCHMEKVTENGVSYTSHNLVSPLESQAILDTCAACHKDVDMAEKVHAIQDAVTAREKEVGNSLSAFKDQLAAAVASGEYTEEELNAIRVLYRHAQWFFDYQYVENSEGAHNSKLANSCLDQAEAKIAEGMQLFHNAPVPSEVFTGEEAVQAPAKTAGELILDSYNATAENSYAVPYLETDPYLVNLYEGFGFAKQYDSARGHAYSLEDLANTARPHPLANCLTCKTADFTKLVQEQGVSAYSLDFDEVMASMNESIGCYSCHADKTDTGELVVTHDYFTDKLDMSGIDAATLSCGQCHIEYYFDPATKATTIPYTNAAEMTPEAMLAYYDAMDFADWTQPSTGAKLLKAQHPEMETYLNGSIHANFGMSCASCHMEKVTENGVSYTSHNLVSPLESQAILDTCAACHKDVDMAEKVHAIQDQVTAREKEVGNNLSAFKDQLAQAVASGEYTEEELDAIRVLYRHAQWFFDYQYVENSEGAHNSKLANSCLDQAAAKIEEGMQLFHTA